MCPGTLAIPGTGTVAPYGIHPVAIGGAQGGQGGQNKPFWYIIIGEGSEIKQKAGIRNSKRNRK